MWDNLQLEVFYDSPFLWVPISWSNIALIWSEADILGPGCQSEIDKSKWISSVGQVVRCFDMNWARTQYHICRNLVRKSTIGFTFQGGHRSEWWTDGEATGAVEQLAAPRPSSVDARFGLPPPPSHRRPFASFNVDTQLSMCTQTLSTLEENLWSDIFFPDMFWHLTMQRSSRKLGRCCWWKKLIPPRLTNEETQYEKDQGMTSQGLDQKDHHT